MKKLCAVLLCACLLFLCPAGAHGSSIIAVESIEDALLWKSDEFNGSVCVVVGEIAEHTDPNHSQQTSKLLVERVLYGDVGEVYIKKTNDINLEGSDPTPGMTYLLLLQPSLYTMASGKVVRSDLYTRVGVYQCQFCFVNGELRGQQNLVEEILADDPTIDTMDELARYFEKRIDALQREGKLPPDPVNWPGVLVASGSLAVLSGLTAVLIRKRNRVVL
ncbi:MAG: hypothetical protein IKU17_01310 [Clostridia bacterium]|nr:hypothetical protein [Clostridia bacterium]